MATIPGPASELRPRTVGEILDASFVLYRHRFGSLLLAVTVLSVPTLVVAVLLSRGAGAAFHDYLATGFEWMRLSGRPSRAANDAMQKWLATAPDVQIYALVSSVMQALSRGAACVAGAIVAWAAVRREPIPGAWRLVRLSLPYVASATMVHVLLAVVGLMAGICCVLLPVSIVLGAVLAPAYAIVAVERPAAGRGTLTRPFAEFGAAVARSFRLSMHAMTIARGTTCISMLLVFVSAIVSAIALAAGWATKSFGVTFVLQHYAEVLFLPVIGVGFGLWYADLRVRREGLDFGEPA